MLPDWYRGLCTFFTNVPLINVYILPIKNGETEPVFIGVYEVQQVVPTVMTSFCLSMKDIEKISLIITLKNKIDVKQEKS
jgi:hypothetical protein